MIVHKLCYFVVFSLLTSTVFTQAVRGDASAAEPPMRDALKHFNKAKQFEQENKYDEAVKELRKAIESDPDYVAAHEAFISDSYNAADTDARKRAPKEKKAKARRGELLAKLAKLTGLAFEEPNRKLLAIYEQWNSQYPNHAAILCSLAEINNVNPAKAQQYYEQALRADPQFAKAYVGLARLARGGFNLELERQYYKKAYEVNPADGSSMLAYAETFAESDPERLRSLVEEIVAKFPNDLVGLDALRALVAQTEDRGERVAIHERIRRLYPPEKNESFRSFDVVECVEECEDYMVTDPAKAVAILQEAITTFPAAGWRGWYGTQLAYAQALAKARDLIAQQKFSDALALLDTTKILPFIKAAPLQLLRAAALAGAGGPAKAYDDLLASLVGEPNADLQASLLQYAAQTNHTPKQAESDLWKLRYQKAQLMKDFELTSYDGKPVKLSEFRGKLVLVNFFYPMCGSCIRELPYLQQTYQKYQSRDVVFLSINIVRSQDDMVQPIWKKLGLSFTVLRMPDDEWAKTQYNMYSAPANMLLDSEGRILFKPTAESHVEQKKLEEEIDMLLAQAAAERASKAATAQLSQ